MTLEQALKLIGERAERGQIMLRVYVDDVPLSCLVNLHVDSVLTSAHFERAIFSMAEIIQNTGER